MSLRNKLIKLTNEKTDAEKAVDLIHSTNPKQASLYDVLFLLRLIDPKPNNQLAYLQFEAYLWYKKNWKVIEKRFEAAKTS